MKSRYWSFIVYPESVKENWKDILTETGIQCAISPLHDKDINPTGEEKKAHYHIVLQFDGPTTYKNVKENICDKIGATIPQKVISLRGYYRYLCHLDNPEKYQYNPKEIIEIGGFNLDLTTSEVNMIKGEIIQDIKRLGIVEYRDIVDYYLSIGDYDKFDIISNKTYFFDKYIGSTRYSENEKVSHGTTNS